ncbi:cysteine proteinase inhibitor 8-like [Panicum virgatum]|uniref:Cystatin domain-containing protein n=1 Tax=Panicum virgatum TaxID=38727 RepID=A0A8T0NP48_PANVG|nr:cysteine proteinase inhibitor 8-like [Panicum virgatum]KAG2551033.1 hypothetical protein PVAP13_9KG438100 [Panicum virgatum]
MRAIRSSLLIGAAVIIALCSVAPAAAARAAHIIVGGWRPIKDVKDPHIQELGGWSPAKDVSDPHIQELGSWAVAEHTRQANDGLRFGKVISAQEQQIVDGVNYKLFLDAADASGDVANYGALVHEQERTNTRELTAFARAPAK